MGLLSNSIGPRKCPRDQATMTLLPGLWVLQQVQRGAGIINSGQLSPTGQLLTVLAHCCPTCGYVELVNEGVS